jgi:uroporphyrinogen decarboxylase
LKIVEYCKKINTPVICFPKGIKENYKQFNDFVKPNALSLDSEINPLWAKANLKNVVLQGGMDPKILLKPEKEIYEEAKKYLDTFKDVPYIFNLGHGLIPETEPEKVKNLIKFVREYK